MAVDNTRDKILTVANTLFSKFGFHKTSMDEIAKIARKAKGSLYYHFSSKETLFTEVVNNELNLLKGKLEIVVYSEQFPATEKLRQYFVKRMAELNKAVNYHEVLKADFFEHFDFIDKLRVDMDQWEKANLKRIILEGVDNKEFVMPDDVDVLMDVFIMVFKGFEIPFYLQDRYHDYAPHFDSLINILTKGLSV